MEQTPAGQQALAYLKSAQENQAAPMATPDTEPQIDVDGMPLTSAHNREAATPASETVQNVKDYFTDIGRNIADYENTPFGQGHLLQDTLGVDVSNPFHGSASELADTLVGPFAAYRGAVETAAGLTTPKNIGIALATGGLGEMGVAGAAIQRGLMGYFAGLGITGAAHSTAAAYDSIVKEGDWDKGFEQLGMGGTQAVLGALAARAALRGLPQAYDTFSKTWDLNRKFGGGDPLAGMQMPGEEALPNAPGAPLRILPAVHQRRARPQWRRSHPRAMPEPAVPEPARGAATQKPRSRHRFPAPSNRPMRLWAPTDVFTSSTRRLANSIRMNRSPYSI